MKDKTEKSSSSSSSKGIHVLDGLNALSHIYFMLQVPFKDFFAPTITSQWGLFRLVL